MLDRYLLLIAENGKQKIPLIFRRNESVMWATLGQIGEQIALAPENARLESQDGLSRSLTEWTGAKPISMPQWWPPLQRPSLVILSASEGRCARLAQSLRDCL